MLEAVYWGLQFGGVVMLPRIDVALLLPDGFFPSEAFCSLRASVLLTFSQLGLVVCFGE